MITIISTLLLIFNFVIGIVILVYYFKNFKEVNYYIKYGIFMSAACGILILLAGGFEVSTMLLFAINLIKIYIHTCVGMHLCEGLGLIDLPLLRKIFRHEDIEKINIKKYFFNIIAAIAGTVAFSYGLFKLTSPRISEGYKMVLEKTGGLSEFGSPPSISIILAIMATVIVEEITFRFVIPNYLANKFNLENHKYWISIGFSSLLWTFAHANVLSPEWVKFVQIFPVGLVLGGMYKKLGLESCIIAHMGFNIGMMFISRGLVLY